MRKLNIWGKSHTYSYIRAIAPGNIMAYCWLGIFLHSLHSWEYFKYQTSTLTIKFNIRRILYSTYLKTYVFCLHMETNNSCDLTHNQ